MNAAEIVPSHVGRNGSFKMRQILAESVCESPETAKVHSDRQVGAFNVTGRNMANVRIAANWRWDSVDHVPKTAAVRLRGASAAFFILVALSMLRSGIGACSLRCPRTEEH